MILTCTCPCGKRWLVDDEGSALVTCPACGQKCPRPAEAEPRRPANTPSVIAGLAAAPAPPEGLVTFGAAGGPAGLTSGALPVWNRRYWFLALTLLPLLLFLFRQDDPEFLQRLQETIRTAPPGTEEKLKTVMSSDRATLNDLMAALPEDRLNGALLPRETWMHWLFAFATATVFWGGIILLFPPGAAKPKDLLRVGLFTGTLGIFFLLAVQYVASWTQDLWLKGGGLVTIFFYIIKFIGFSYQAALNPENGFWLSFLGFTCGVGFCEEICKALPLVRHFHKKATLDWRGACLWGLATGVGFGVSEGITYCSDYYNGISSGGIYLVRFISCVGLHAIWSAAAGISIYWNQHGIQGDQMGIQDYALPLLKILAIPMVLHGLYDTLLKKEMEGWACVVAAFSFGWLAFQIERMRHMEEQIDAEPRSA